MVEHDGKGEPLTSRTRDVSGERIDVADRSGLGPDVAFRFSTDKWIFNMATNNLTKNTTYYYRIPLADGSYIYFHFGTK